MKLTWVVGHLRKANAIDAEIGRRICQRRLAIGMGQQELAARLRVSFQLIQKYETGLLRIGAGRMHAIADALCVPAAFFFDRSAGICETSSTDEKELVAFVQTGEGIELNRAFRRIASPAVRRTVLALVAALGHDQSGRD